MGITLLAAVLHATWNAVAHGVSDRLVGFALIGVALDGGGLSRAALPALGAAVTTGSASPGTR